MRNLVLLALSLAIFMGGVYVGRSPSIVVNVPDIQVKCRPGHTEPATSNLVAAVATPAPAITPTPSPSATPSTLPAEAPLAKTEEAPTITNDDRENQQTCEEWVRDKVKEGARWIAKYDQKDYKLTLTREEMSCLPLFRSSAEAVNLFIVEEGPIAVGSYVYYILVNAK